MSTSTSEQNVLNQEVSLLSILDLPDELGSVAKINSSDEGTPFFEGITEVAEYYRYRDTYDGHEHFTTGM